MPIRRSLLDTVYAGTERAFMREFPEYQKSNFVKGEGSDEPAPTVMVVGEAPGAQEDIKGRPFCGQSGIILRMMMAHAGLNMGTPRQAGNTWLTNVVKLRPPGNRTPKPEEIELARPYLRREWEAIGEPSIVVCVGNVPLIAVTGWGSVSKRATGLPETYSNADGHTMWVWPMLHPSNAVRHPTMQPILETHWEMFGDWFSGWPF